MLSNHNIGFRSRILPEIPNSQSSRFDTDLTQILRIYETWDLGVVEGWGWLVWHSEPLNNVSNHNIGFRSRILPEIPNSQSSRFDTDLIQILRIYETWDLGVVEGWGWLVRHSEPLNNVIQP